MMRIMARGDEGSDGRGITFKVARQAAIATDPGECPFDDPSLGRDFESGSMGSLHDFQLPCSRVGGTSRPSAFAVLRLMISSTFVDCWTGRSAGFSPLRMRPA